uniref:Uncharacterized protein n=1 Tax=Plectus sambesii TaxID=2011161 RepID=A0A914UM32_9BILA
MDLSEYVVNGEWVLLATPARRTESFYKCCPEPYPSVYFYMHIRRRTLYYGFNLIIPSLLISLMTVLGFTLPPDAGEKITLEITILLSVCFFLSMVAEMTPPTSEAVPLIGTFFSCCMLVVSASVVFTVVVLNLHFRSPDTHEMSPFVRIVLLKWLPWLLMMRRPGQKFSRQAFLHADEDRESNHSAAATMMTPITTPFSQSTESESLMRNVRPLEVGLNVSFADKQLEHHENCCVINNCGQRAPPLGQLGTAACDRTGSVDFEARIHSAIVQLSSPDRGDPAVHAQLLMLHRVYTELKFITQRMQQEDEDEDAQNDWKFAAMVVDRLCLIVFSTFIVASTCGIMFSAPHLNA